MVAPTRTRRTHEEVTSLELWGAEVAPPCEGGRGAVGGPVQGWP